MSKVFISYKRKDREKVFKLKEKLEASIGMQCWIDLHGIASDAAFANVIVDAINDCEVFLFMYSHAVSEIVDYGNDWTVRELNFAQEKRKRIVFVNIDKTPLSDWFRLMFGTKQQVDGTSDESFRHLERDLRRWLKVKEQPLVQPPTQIYAQPMLKPGANPKPISKTTYNSRLVTIYMWLQSIILAVLFVGFTNLTWLKFSTDRPQLLFRYLCLCSVLLLMIACTIRIKKQKWYRWSFLILDVVAIVLVISCSMYYYKGQRHFNTPVYQELRNLAGIYLFNPPLFYSRVILLYLLHNLCVLCVMYSKLIWHKLPSKLKKLTHRANW